VQRHELLRDVRVPLRRVVLARTLARRAPGSARATVPFPRLPFRRAPSPPSRVPTLAGGPPPPRIVKLNWSNFLQSLHHESSKYSVYFYVLSNISTLSKIVEPDRE